MSTYKEIQSYVKVNYGFSPKTCWIADVKEMCGIEVKVSSNRISVNKRKNPCPYDKVECIKLALKHFNMI